MNRNAFGVKLPWHCSDANLRLLSQSSDALLSETALLAATKTRRKEIDRTKKVRLQGQPTSQNEAVCSLHFRFP